MFAATDINTLPLNQKWLDGDRLVEQYSRGIFLIVLAHSQVEPYLTDVTPGGDFLEFKRSQGFDVEVVSMNTLGLSTTDASELRNWLHIYSNDNPMLEYVLLVGDVTGALTIPTHFIPSINEPEMDVTDYPYTYFNDDPDSEDYDVIEPRFIIGRWSISNPGDLMMLKSRTIQYTRMDNLSNGDMDYLDRSLIAASTFEEGSYYYDLPNPPIMTSRWLANQLTNYGHSQVDTAFTEADDSLICNAWSNGVGSINYLGWANSQGWHNPAFHIDLIENLNHGWKLPVVASFVCNTGDFGADLINGPVKCFAEELTTRGTLGSPKGAVAVIGPSDLVTDMIYSNIMNGYYWQTLLNGTTAEIGVALHLSKQSLAIEFPQYSGHGDIVEFYHHIYMVIGDPSIPAWLLQPLNLFSDIEADTSLHHSYLSTIITNDDGYPVEEVVGALILDGELIGKGLSGPDGTLQIDFDGVEEGSTLSFFLNKAQFYQKEIILNYIEDDGSQIDPVIWANFDVQAELSSGNEYVQSEEYIQLAVNVMNPSSYTYNDIEVSISELTNDFIIGNFETDVISIDAFSSITTDYIVTGIMGDLSNGASVLFQVEFILDGDTIAENTLSIMFGPIEDSDPIPADSYGYWTYDNSDIGYPETPVFDWIELNPADGGDGVLIPMTDDSHYDLDLPFAFQYYGESFSSVTVGSNGWISLNPCNINYSWNFSIPTNMGPTAMIAPFMDDLDDNGGMEPFDVFVWGDADDGVFIIQWDNVSNAVDDEFCQTIGCVKETFQVILYDPDIYITQTGDGEILFQYEEINDLDENGNYSTIGIESPDGNTGVQYLFNNISGSGANWPVDVLNENGYTVYHLNQELAIKFTTNHTVDDENLIILGCTDEFAMNYNPDANDDDDSCEYYPVGDLNQDVLVDILDIIILIDIIMGDIPSEYEQWMGDQNEDGLIDVLDIVMIIECIMTTCWDNSRIQQFKGT